MIAIPFTTWRFSIRPLGTTGFRVWMDDLGSVAIGDVFALSDTGQRFVIVDIVGAAAWVARV